MNNNAQQIQSFLSAVSNSRGGVLPPEEAVAIGNWYQEVLDNIHFINLVIGGDAIMSWNKETNEPVCKLTPQGFNNANPDLREKAIRKDAIN